MGEAGSNAFLQAFNDIQLGGNADDYDGSCTRLSNIKQIVEQSLETNFNKILFLIFNTLLFDVTPS